MPGEHDKNQQQLWPSPPITDVGALGYLERFVGGGIKRLPRWIRHQHGRARVTKVLAANGSQTVISTPFRAWGDLRGAWPKAHTGPPRVVVDLAVATGTKDRQPGIAWNTFSNSTSLPVSRGRSVLVSWPGLGPPRGRVPGNMAPNSQQTS